MTLKIIVKGIAKGKIMKTNIPINFLEQLSQNFSKQKTK